MSGKTIVLAAVVAVAAYVAWTYVRARLSAGAVPDGPSSPASPFFVPSDSSSPLFRAVFVGGSGPAGATPPEIRDHRY